MRGRAEMTAKEELINYLLSLNPKQVDKVINHIPQLYESILEQAQPCRQE